MKIDVEHNLRSYVPTVRWYWYDGRTGALVLSFGNHYCDPLFSVGFVFRPSRRLRYWLPW